MKQHTSMTECSITEDTVNVLVQMQKPMHKVCCKHLTAQRLMVNTAHLELIWLTIVQMMVTNGTTQILTN